MELKLVVVGGESQPTEITLSLPAVIGRGREVDLVLAHPLVSRQHCELREANGQVEVCDLESMNGTFVGSARVTTAVLAPGELLTVGTVTFRAAYGTAAGAQADAGPAPSQVVLSTEDEMVDPVDQTLPVPQKKLAVRDAPTSKAPQIDQPVSRGGETTEQADWVKLDQPTDNDELSEPPK